MSGTDALLSVYDAQLRTRAETIGADIVRRIGPLHCAIFPGDQGFVTYQRPNARDAASILRLLPTAMAFFEEAGVRQIEWKTRGHDLIPGLEEALEEDRFHPEGLETVMMGRAEFLASAPEVPGVVIERAGGEDGILAALSTADRLFGAEPSQARGRLFLEAIGRAKQRGLPEPQVWIARLKGRIICSGRLEPVPGTECAGLWGGVTDPDFRGLGIYRALTAARAKAALALGATYLYSDSTPMSRRILERSGLTAITSTTPFIRFAGA